MRSVRSQPAILREWRRAPGGDSATSMTMPLRSRRIVEYVHRVDQIKAAQEVNARREANWSTWCADVVAVSALAPGLAERARRLLVPLLPDAAVAETLSRAYGSRTMQSARAALRAAIRAASAQTADASTLVASELMALESKEQEDTLAGIDRHGVDGDAVSWGDEGATLRDGDGVMETRSLLSALLELPGVCSEVRDLGLDVLDGLAAPTLSQDLRRAWAIVNGDPVPPTAGGAEPATSDVLASMANELRAIRAEVSRRATPYEGTADWIEDVVSTLPTLLDQGEAAKVLGVDPRTIRRMIIRGELKSVDVGEGGRGRSCGVRIPRASIADFLRQKEAPGQ